MRPRQDRWFLLVDLATVLEPHHPELATMKRASRRKAVYRMVRKMERLTGRRYARRVGRALYVSKNALENLLPQKQLESLDDLEKNQVEIATQLRRVIRQVNGHSSRITKLEKKQELTTKYLQEISGLD